MKNPKDTQQAQKISNIAFTLFFIVIVSYIFTKVPFDAPESTKSFWAIICGVTAISAIVFLKYKDNYIKINDLFKKK